MMTFMSILNDIDNFKDSILKESIEGFVKEDFQRVLKGEIRQTLYHSIETLFELIFALLPKYKNQLEDVNILANLSSSDWRANNKRIEEISENDNGLDFLDATMNVNAQTISLARYLFYYGVLPDNQSIPKAYLDSIDSSIESIKYGLKIVAKEFIERNEYNSYKHGLRIIPILSKFYLGNPETKETLAEWDLKDSMTYLHFPRDKNSNVEIEMITVAFNTNRDLGLCIFCAHLIANLILLRRSGLRLAKKDEKIQILFFKKEEISKINNISVPMSKLHFKIESISKE